MTIAQLIENLCILIGEMASLIDNLAMRLMQTGCMTEGEFSEVREIQRRIEAIGISPPPQNGTKGVSKESLNSDGAGH